MSKKALVACVCVSMSLSGCGNFTNTVNPQSFSIKNFKTNSLLPLGIRPPDPGYDSRIELDGIRPPNPGFDNTLTDSTNQANNIVKTDNSIAVWEQGSVPKAKPTPNIPPKMEIPPKPSSSTPPPQKETTQTAALHNDFVSSGTGSTADFGEHNGGVRNLGNGTGSFSNQGSGTGSFSNPVNNGFVSSGTGKSIEFHPSFINIDPLGASSLKLMFEAEGDGYRMYMIENQGVNRNVIGFNTWLDQKTFTNNSLLGIGTHQVDIRLENKLKSFKITVKSSKKEGFSTVIKLQNNEIIIDALSNNNEYITLKPNEIRNQYPLFEQAKLFYWGYLDMYGGTALHPNLPQINWNSSGHGLAQAIGNREKDDQLQYIELENENPKFSSCNIYESIVSGTVGFGNNTFTIQPNEICSKYNKNQKYKPWLVFDQGQAGAILDLQKSEFVVKALAFSIPRSSKT